MNPVTPPAVDGAAAIVFAKEQPEYLPLPANATPDGDVVTEWELDEVELAAINASRRIRLTVKTFNRPLQPIFLEVAPAAAPVPVIGQQPVLVPVAGVVLGRRR